MSRVAVVTGATGFTGARLARRLLADGWRVIVLARASSSLTYLGDAAAHVELVRIGSDRAADVALAVRTATLAAPDVVFSLAVHRPTDSENTREPLPLV